MKTLFLIVLPFAAGAFGVMAACSSSDDGAAGPLGAAEAGAEAAVDSPDGATPIADAGDAGDGHVRDAATRSYCEARLSYDARCQPTLVCDTSVVCPVAEPYVSPGWIAATIACEGKAVACDQVFTCQAEAAKAAPRVASQNRYIHDYCALCRPSDAAACEASPFAGKSQSMSLALTLGAPILDLAVPGCFDPDLDGGTTADGGALTCDQRVAKCTSAFAKAKLPDINCHTK